MDSVEVKEKENRNKKQQETTCTDDKSDPLQYDVPVDRGWAWVVLLGAFGVCTLAIGGLKSFGVLYVELSRTYSVSNKALASIQSLTGFFYLGTGPVANALSLKYSHRVVVFTGGVVAATGLVLSSFAKSVTVLYVTYGVITGIGLGLTFAPTFVILAYYFEKRRSFANGLSMSGSGIGSTALPYLMRYLMDVYSIQGCLLLIGAIMSHLCLFGLMYRPLNHYPIKKYKSTNEIQGNVITKDEEVPLMVRDSRSNDAESLHEKNIMDAVINKEKLQLQDFPTNRENISGSAFSSQTNIRVRNNISESCTSTLIEKFKCQERLPHHSSRISLNSGNASLYASLGVLSSLSCQNIPESVNLNNSNVRTFHDQEIISETQEKRKNKFSKFCFSLNVDWTLFKDSRFIIYMFSILCLNCGYHSVFNTLPPYAEELRISDNNGAFLIAVFGMLDFCGRFLVGIAMDICPNFKKQIYFVCTFICAVGVLFTSQFETLLGLSMFCGFYGFFGGGYNGTLMSVLVESMGLDRISSAWGFMCLSGSIAMLLHPFLSGLMKDVTGTWKNSFILMGCIALIGSLSLLLQPVLLDHSKKTENRSHTVFVEEINTNHRENS